MYETTVTVLGRVATTVTQVTFNDGGLKASFRLASTERRFDRDQQTWVDGAAAVPRAWSAGATSLIGSSPRCGWAIR